MKSLLFGPAGVPLSAPSRSTLDGVPRVRELGLGCMELEFVRGVRMAPTMAKQVRVLAEKNNVVLTAHGPYYINLNSQDNSITSASINRILETARISSLCGAFSITFHAAYYMSLQKERVYELVKSHMRNITRTLKNENIKLWVRPETTGKATQFGDVDELIKLSQEVEQVLPCVDFAHLHARSNGKINSYAEFSSVLEKLEKGIGREALDNMHIHISGIEYGEKGEKNHLVLKESDMNYKDLMRALKDFKCKGCVINESPNLEVDAELMKKEYEKLK
ncbi:TIM barrel protein [Candidatus Woesearchaeota archaeon]|nr:TIM barrel protein [Candidatus Woesearchaeota archaeon]